MEDLAQASPQHTRPVIFAPQVQELLARKEKVFRIDETTVGVADSELIRTIVATRPVLASERSVFKPAAGADIDHDDATRTIRALGQDVTTGLRTPPPPAAKMTGAWPFAGISYLRGWLFSADPMPIRLLTNRRIVHSDRLSRIADLAVSVWPSSDAARPGTALAGSIHDASGLHDARQASALYRRAIAVLSEGVAALASNALWLMNPTTDDCRDRPADLDPILWETLRLLPPAWMLWRTGGPEYARLHPAIGPEDNVAMFPLLLHRDPDHWPDPLEFRPERWAGIADPESVPGFVPFGFDGARCWAKHLVVPLAARLLGAALDGGVKIQRTQQDTYVPLRSLLSVRFDVEAAA